MGIELTEDEKAELAALADRLRATSKPQPLALKTASLALRGALEALQASAAATLSGDTTGALQALCRAKHECERAGLALDLAVTSIGVDAYIADQLGGGAA